MALGAGMVNVGACILKVQASFLFALPEYSSTMKYKFSIQLFQPFIKIHVFESIKEGLISL